MTPREKNHERTHQRQGTKATRVASEERPVLAHRRCRAANDRHHVAHGRKQVAGEGKSDHLDRPDSCPSRSERNQDRRAPNQDSGATKATTRGPTCPRTANSSAWGPKE